MRWLRALAALAVLSVIPPLLTTATASAAPTWTPSEVLGVGGKDVRMDVGPTGDAVAAWSFDKGIKASYRPAGKNWQRPVVLKRNVSGMRAAFVDARGVARVVWWDEGHAQMGVATRSLRGTWRLDDDAPGSQDCCWTSTPSVAGDDDGNLVVAWQEVDDLDPGASRYFFWRTPSGRWTSVDGGTDSYRSGIVVVDGMATVVDGWEQLREATASRNHDLQTTRVLRAEGNFGAPELGANGAGEMVTAVLDGTADADGVMQTFDPGELVLLTREGGSEWRTVHDGGGAQVDSLALAMNEAGDYVVAYRRVEDRAVVTRLGHVAGSLGPERVLGANGHEGAISVAIAPNGDTAVLWSTGRRDRGPAYAATGAAEGGWSEPVRLGSHETSWYATELGLEAYPNGMFTALLYDGTAARWVDLVDDDAAPATMMRAPRRDYTTGAKIKVAWAATDDLSRPDAYDVRYRVAGRSGGFGRWHRWLTDTERIQKVFKARPGRTYCFAARTTDRAGNVGRWSARRCAASPIDDRTLSTRTGGWDRVHNRRAYRDTLTVADRRGQTLRLGRVSASEIRLMVRTCPRCGTVEVRHAGRRIGVVDAASSRVRNRVVLVESYDRARTGALVVRSRNGRSVRIDGVLAIR